MEGIKRYKNSHLAGHSKIELIAIDWISVFPQRGADGYLKSYIQRKNNAPWAIEDEADFDTIKISEKSKIGKAGQLLKTAISYDISTPSPEVEIQLNDRSKQKFIAIVTDLNGFKMVYGTLEAPLSFEWSKSKDAKPSGKNKYQIKLSCVQAEGPAYYWTDLLATKIKNPQFDSGIQLWQLIGNTVLTWGTPANSPLGFSLKIEAIAYNSSRAYFVYELDPNKQYRFACEIYCESGEWKVSTYDMDNASETGAVDNIIGHKNISFTGDGANTLRFYIQRRTGFDGNPIVSFVDNISIQEIIRTKP